MTKRDYFNVAYALRNSNPREHAGDWSSDAWYASMLQWEKTVLAVANHLGSQYRNFNRGMFLAAAGYSILPDGSMWRVDWATNRIPNFRSI